MAQEIIQHKNIRRGNRHGITEWRVQVEADLLSIGNLTSNDLDKVAYVLDTDSYYIVTTVDIPTGTGTWKKFL